MRRFSFKTAGFIFAFLLCAFVFSGCEKRIGDGNGPQSNGEGILGRSAVATLDNARVRCDFVALGELHYDVHCYTVVFDGVSEVRATRYAPNVRAVWRTVEQIMGPVVTALTCSVAPNLLEQRCDVRLASNVQVELAYVLDLTDTATQATHSEPARVLLPWAVRTVGYIPQLPLMQPRVSETDVGILTPELAREKLSIIFGRAYTRGSEILLHQPGFVYRYFENKLRLYAGTHKMDGVALAGQALSSPDSHRLRTDMSGAVTATENGLYVLRPNGDGRQLYSVPDNGPSVLLQDFPPMVGVPPPTGNSGFLVASPDGSFYLGHSVRIQKWSPTGGLQEFAGIGDTRPPGHVETAAATSLYLNVKQMVGLPDGSILVVEQDGQRLIRIFANGTYQVILSATDLPTGNQCWNAPNYFPTAAVSPTGKIYVHWRACTSTFLFEIENGTRTSTTIPHPAGNLSNCSLFPASGSTVPAASFPFSQHSLKLSAVGAGALLYVSDCGVARYSMQAQTVETLITSQIFYSATGVGANGEVASEASITVPTAVGFTPPGDLLVNTGSNLLTVALKENTISTAPLTYNGTQISFFNSDFISPEGQTYKYFMNQLFRAGPTGALTATPVTLPMSASTFNTRFAFESANILYVNVNRVIEKVDITTGTRTPIFSLPLAPSDFSYPLALTLGSDGALYVLIDNRVGRLFPLDGTGTFTIVAGGGESAATDGALAHEIALSGMKHLVADKSGTLYIGEKYNLSSLTPAGTRTDGTPAFHFTRIYPTKAGSDCTGGILSGGQASTVDQFLQILNSVCPGEIKALAVQDTCSSGGNILMGVARSINLLGNILYISKPCP